MDKSSLSLKYLEEQEDLEDPPSLKPGAYVSHSPDEPAPLSQKKSLFNLSSFSWKSKKKTKKKMESERKYDEALYSFGKSNATSSPQTQKLSSSNLKDLNDRLRSFKSSRTLHSRGDSLSEPESTNKMPQLFASHFTYSKNDITELISGYGQHLQSGNIDNKLMSMEEGEIAGNQNPLIQSLKAALKTMSSEIDSLLEHCIDIEDSYMDAARQASEELQQSMNVLFQYQQTCQKLEETKQLVQASKDEVKAIKQRLVEKEKERRMYKMQCEEKDVLIKRQTSEITELNKILGESSDNLAQMKIDAKLANTVIAELDACKQKNKSLRDEVIRLRELLGHSDSKEMQTKESIRSENTDKDAVELDSVAVGLDDLYEAMNLQRKDQHTDIVAERENLQSAVSTLNKKLEDKKVELEHAQINLKSMETKLSKFLEGRTGDDTKVNLAELEAERDQREQLEEILAEERQRRQEVEENFSDAHSEWKALMTEVEQDIKQSHQTIEEMKEEKSIMLKQMEKLKKENAELSVASGSTAAVRELENRLMQSFSETRRAHLMNQEIKGVAYYDIRVFVNVSDATSANRTNFAITNHDQNSLQLKGDDEKDSIAARKYIFDKVFSMKSRDKLVDSLDEYIKYAISGKQTSVLSYGRTEGNKTEFMFGNSVNSNSTVHDVLNNLIAQLRTKEQTDQIVYDVKLSFVRILEEDILDLFCEDSNEEVKKVHEIKRTSDGSTTITNVNLIDVNVRDERDIQSAINRVLTARHVYSENSTYSSVADWQSDCAQSHFVLTVLIKGVQSGGADGKLTMVELAGDDEIDEASDDVSASKSKRSLQCFSDMISSISKRQSHIPFRNTKITYILQPSFSLNGKSLIVFGLNQDMNYAVAYRILQFANKVFQCTILPTLVQTSGSGGSGSLKSMGSVRALLKDGRNRAKVKNHIPPGSFRK